MAAGLGDVLARALIGRAPYKRPPTLKQMIGWAYRRGGKTWRGAARELGVSESTLRLWRKGGPISARKLDQIRAQTAARRAERIRRGNLAQKGENAARIQFTFDGRPRDYPVSNLKLRDGTLKRVQDHLMAGRTAEAVRAFLQGIGDPWYRDHFTAYESLAHAGDSADNDTPDDIPDYDDPTTAAFDPDTGEIYDLGEYEEDYELYYGWDAADEDVEYEFGVIGMR